MFRLGDTTQRIIWSTTYTGLLLAYFIMAKQELVIVLEEFDDNREGNFNSVTGQGCKKTSFGEQISNANKFTDEHLFKEYIKNEKKAQHFLMLLKLSALSINIYVIFSMLSKCGTYCC